MVWYPITMRRVVFAGDWHGNTPWAVRMVERCAEEGVSTLVHVGDFGLWRDGRGDEQDYLPVVSAACATAGVNIHIIPGNHEDWDWLDLLVEQFGPGDWVPVEPGIQFAPRGFVWEWDGVVYGAMPGAVSLDRGSRTRGFSWFPQELATIGDVYRLAENAERFGGAVNVLVSHEAPACVDTRLPPLEHSKLGVDVVWDANQQRELLDRAVNAVKPSLVVHGHQHTFRYQGVTVPFGEGMMLALSLDCEYREGNAFVATFNGEGRLDELRKLVV